MGKTGAEGGGAQQMMYGFIFVMYAITAGVLFYVMFNRYVSSVRNNLIMTRSGERERGREQKPRKE